MPLTVKNDQLAISATYCRQCLPLNLRILSPGLLQSSGMMQRSLPTVLDLGCLRIEDLFVDNGHIWSKFSQSFSSTSLFAVKKSDKVSERVVRKTSKSGIAGTFLHLDLSRDQFVVWYEWS